MSIAQHDSRRRRSPTLAAAVSAALAMTSSATAQTVAGLEEIVVTATRRSERLQDVSASISAFDTNAIALRGLLQMDDYAKFVPGLSLGVREPGGTTIVFRGVASSGVQFGAVSSSGLYLDEQPITQSGRNPDPRLIDIERLEALRGPQGTLYGASSQSGTLRVITNKPDPSGFNAWTEASLNSVDGGGVGYDLSAMVNVPLVDDKLALRLVGFTAEDAGYIDRVLSDSQGGTFDNSNVVEKDVNDIRTSGGRAALRWDANEDIAVTLGAIFQDRTANGHGDVTPGAGDLNQVRFEDESLDDRWYQAALTLNARLPFGDAMLAVSYFDRKFDYQADATDYEFRFNQNAINYGAVIYDFGGDPRGFATNSEDTQITTLEARLASPSGSESRWGWLAGVFYSQEEQQTSFNSYVRGYENTPAFQYFSDYEARLTGNELAPTERWFLGRYDTELDQVAVFGEVSFDVTENFKITAGGRWFDYDRKFAQVQESPEGFSGFSRLDGTQQSSEDGTVSKLNLSYRIDEDRLLYATFSEGFRVGGSNPVKAASLLPSTFDSDVLTSYELGAKTEWLDSRLRFNVAVYYMEWDDFAVQVEDPQPAVFQLGFVNLPSAEIPGIEADFAATLGEQWQIDGALSWNDAQTAGASTLSVTDSDGEVYEFSVEDGARLPLTPDWTATLGIEFRSTARWLEAQPFARFDYAYVGESVNSLEGIESVVSGNPVEILPSYQTGDLRFGLESDGWTASLFIDNLWDERAVTFISNRWATQRYSINQPRTFGIQLRLNF
jgi:iron complex outermembrane recepter protein